MLSCKRLDFMLSKHCDDLAPGSLEDSIGHWATSSLPWPRGPHWQREGAAPDASEGLSPGPASSASRWTALGEAALGKHSPRSGDLGQKLGGGMAQLCSRTIERLHCNQDTSPQASVRAAFHTGLFAISSYISATEIEARLLFRSDKGY